MGKGDIKTRKGKRSAGSYGVSRKRKIKKAMIEVKPKKKATKKASPAKKETTAKKTATKKTATKKSED